ncbi:hypothetical protein H8M03_07615 [Sphingomonas sabuli]|uniref:DUF1579 domain-containing protein n=1 Tax=Sphingomonas sabuli TaxID=2764186 RepID=A0A7G9KZW3_9SPHN|nr:hypothetical protein [Sphingomonas sabuli]QNM81912.1 hypothetical protein H8M03_07615 [Sphingomonas sabuli]
MIRPTLRLALLPAALALAAAAHPPEIEQQLAFLAGDWTMAGKESQYRDNCTWFDDRSFIVCDTTDGRPGGHHSVAVLGWSKADGHFTYQQYDNSGRSRTERCYPNDRKGITCLGSLKTDEGFVETRSHIWPTPTGLGISQDRATNGGAFKEVGRVDYIRRR